MATNYWQCSAYSQLWLGVCSCKRRPIVNRRINKLKQKILLGKRKRNVALTIIALDSATNYWQRSAYSQLWLGVCGCKRRPIVNRRINKLKQRILLDKRKRNVAIAIIVFGPLMISLIDVSPVNAAFKFAQIRKEEATVHIKKPWAYRVVKLSMITPSEEKSFLKGDYVKFDKVKVLWHAIGNKVVIEVQKQNGSESAKTLAIPKEAIEVE